MAMSSGRDKTKHVYHKEEFRKLALKSMCITEGDIKALISSMKKMIMQSGLKDPIDMFFEVLKQSEERWRAAVPLPVHGEWHHILVPGVIVSALRNNGFDISDRDVTEAMLRGEQAAVSCGFTGVCGGANSMGIVGAIVKKTTPLLDDERQELMLTVAELLRKIAQIKRRCCKRSSYITIEETIRYLATLGLSLPNHKISCRYSSQNSMCLKGECPFYFSKNIET